MIELPELPKILKVLWCDYNNLIGLPELPVTLNVLDCHNNNIKYLSESNCQIIKKIEFRKFNILNNPVSNGFDSNEEFRASL